jgi:hypothetical protein
VATDVNIKPGPPWEPSGTTGAVESTPRREGFDPQNPADRKLRSQLRYSIGFLALVFAGFAFSIIFNFAQASRTGGGSGFGDTKLLTPHEAKTFFETHDVSDGNH